jgi:hypothetical protein
MQQLSQNAENGAEPDRKQPHDQIDIYNLAIESTIDSELIDDVLLGLGNYSGREYWQQVDAFRKGLFSVEAFSRRLRERAIEETKTALAKDGIEAEWREAGTDSQQTVDEPGWNNLDEEERAKHDRRRWISAKKDEYWEQLPEQIKYEQIVETAGLDTDWKSPHLRMMMMRHEASRSKGARLMDNLFGRVKEHRGQQPDSDTILKKLRGGQQ